MQNTEIPDRTTIPLHGTPIELVINKPEVVVFDNGVEAYLIEAGDEDVTRIDIVIDAGSAFQEKRLVASSVGKMLKEGTDSFTSSEIANKFDFYGAHFDNQITKDTAALTLFSLTKHLNELMPVLAEMITAATFVDNELQTYIDRQRQDFLVNTERVRFVGMLEFNHMVFGKNSAYGQTVQLGDFDEINRNDLVHFYNDTYIPQHAYMIISGRVNNTVVELINRYIGNNWQAPDNTPPEIQFTSPTTEHEKFVAKKGALQSAIRVGRPIINKTHKDYNRFVLLNTILGGYFGSRLMSNLREEKGYTYGISSYISNYINGASFNIATEVNAKYTQAALDEIYQEIDKLRKQKVSENELQLVKNYIYGTFLRNFDGPFALAERFRSVRDFGLDFDHYRQSLDEILEISAEELIETAEKYLDPDKMIKLVVGSME